MACFSEDNPDIVVCMRVIKAGAAALQLLFIGGLLNVILMSFTDPILQDAVHVSTTARLHMGFFDLNGGLGRRFGSIGVSLDQPSTILTAWRTEQFSAEGPGAERAVAVARKIAQALKLDGGMHLQLNEVIPEHSGLGSGTQMSLAVGLALNKLYQLGLILQDVALLTERGARSGIGLGTFAEGGVVIDGGRGPQTLVPPVIARADFPEEWRIILIFDAADIGVHGSEESEAFRTLPEFPADISAELCRRVLMQALPALAEHDLQTFGTAIRELQERTGDYFSPIQGGRYASKRVGRVLEWLALQGIDCFGQSSWGPTGFAVLANQQAAAACLQTLQSRFENDEHLSFLICKGRNRGGILRDVG
ncbi:MAG: beta-ribofuranosylaminobenzene 5'-phosphate synthase family protein [Methylophilaceae bacterium]|nr:beta-ribofuranosylaminobenzene 5'-phosphate synthase family protein [Methylophilaceae bacterium]